METVPALVVVTLVWSGEAVVAPLPVASVVTAPGALNV